MSEKDSNGISAERIIERLHQFNRKERDHLIKFALCDEPAHPRISKPLWRLVREKNRLHRPDSTLMFVGMDYHLNWLFATLKTSEAGPLNTKDRFKNSWGRRVQSEKIMPRIIKRNGKYIEDLKDEMPIQGNQEDSDLLIAWTHGDSSEMLCLTFVEAKLDSPWTVKQLESKRQRLALIQAASCEIDLGPINWTCLLLSPKCPMTGFNPEDAKQKIQEDYTNELQKFLPKGHPTLRPMKWKWKPWNGSSPKGGRYHVNRISNSEPKYSEWKVSKK